MISREIENSRNNRGEPDRDSECNPLCLGKAAESGTTTAQSDTNPMIKPTMKPSGASAKKINIPRPPSKLET
jgi:hypothetical protein